MRRCFAGVVLALFACVGASVPEPLRDTAGRHHELSVRASRINPEAGEHPKVNYTFTDKKGKITDLQHAAVDTRVLSRGQLVIWLMSHNKHLFESISGYGLHVIQPHYANRWFSTVPKALHDAGNCLGNIRLEAATGDDHSPLVDIPKPDGLAARALEFRLVVGRI